MCQCCGNSSVCLIGTDHLHHEVPQSDVATWRATASIVVLLDSMLVYGEWSDGPLLLSEGCSLALALLYYLRYVYILAQVTTVA